MKIPSVGPPGRREDQAGTEQLLLRHIPASVQAREQERALVAVAHALLVAICHMLGEGTVHRDLGPGMALIRPTKR